MKTIKNIYKEPIVVPYLTGCYSTGSKVQNRAMVQLLVGETLEIEDHRISPELSVMQKKGRVEITDSPVEEQTKSTVADDPSNSIEEQSIEELEKELLG